MSQDLNAAKDLLLNTNAPITKRMRALFYLKNIQTPESAHILSLALSDTSILLKHEICYVLGQMHIPESREILKRTLANKDENEIVRHEAGEALANFLQKDIYNFQLQYTKDESPSVAETCYLAIKKFEDYNNKDSNTDYSPLSPFDSVDPAYPYIHKSIEELESLYLNSNCLYEKYKAMFALRNMKSAEAVYVLAKGFEDKSALFKHEVAFVFGQMRMKESVESMSIVLGRNEHEMVRHECAEALGAIASDEANEVLKMFLKDESRVVRESVEVALDICEYEQGNEPEYATINI